MTLKAIKQVHVLPDNLARPMAGLQGPACWGARA